MALTRCPNCRQRISSLVQQCPHCGYSMDGSGEIALTPEIKLRRLKKLRYRALMGSYTAMSVTLAGIIVWWVRSGLSGLPGQPEFSLMLFGVFAYLGVRGWLYWLNHNIRKLRRMSRP